MSVPGKTLVLAVLVALPAALPAQTAANPTTESSAVALSGVWHIVLKTRTDLGNGRYLNREFRERWTLVQDGDSVYGTMEPAEVAPGQQPWSTKVSGIVMEGKIALMSEPIEARVEEKRAVQVRHLIMKLKGKVTANRMSGTMHTTQTESGVRGPTFTWTASRANGVALRN